jgi:hypothetical protein
LSTVYLNAYIMADGRLTVGVVDAVNTLHLYHCDMDMSEAEEKTKLSTAMKQFYNEIKNERAKK